MKRTRKRIQSLVMAGAMLLCQMQLPECPFTPPEGLEFVGWSANAAFYHPGETIRVLGDLTVLAVWESPYSGACGDNMAWEYDTETNTLTLQGEGMMYDFEAAIDSDGNETFNVPWYSFSGNIEYVNLPEGLTTIGEYAFIDCDHLQSVEIPAGVSSIGNHAFDYCDSLREITLPESVAVIGKNAFANTAALERIIVLNPSANISDYNDATLGNPLTEILILNPKTVIGDSAQTISNGARPNGFDDSHGIILEYYFDGIIDNSDVLILARYVADWDGYDQYIVSKTD